MTKYDMTAIRYLEPGFLPLARNRKSYICPNCGSGSGKNGSGMTSRDGSIGNAGAADCQQTRSVF